MNKYNVVKLFILWFEEIWEEIQIQFYGIIGAILFFLLVYLIFQPNWMQAAIDFFIILNYNYLQYFLE
tara:strand:+ start:785 stop:988 length:204 start_codon:yes stop_codon:yes gene_type:complete